MYSTTGIDASNYVATYNRAFYFIAGSFLDAPGGTYIYDALFCLPL